MTMMTFRFKIHLSFIIFLYSLSTLVGQRIYGVSTEWNDSFREWIIYGEDEDQDGTLDMRWPLRNDWTEWDWDFADIRGEFYMRRPTDPEAWEGSGDGVIVEGRTIWPGDRGKWVIVSGELRIEIRTRYTNIADEWIVDDRKYGKLRMYTDWEGDPRDWIIEDELSEDVHVVVKLFMIHIALMQSIPKL